MQIDPKETVQIKRSHGMSLLMVAGSALFVFLGHYLATEGMEAAQPNPFEQGLGTVTMVFFGLMGVAWIVEILRTPFAVIQIGPEGFLDFRVCEETIPWSALKHASVIRQGRISSLRLVLDEDFKRRMNHRWLYRLAICLNRVFDAKAHFINTTALEPSADKLIEIIMAYAKAHGSPAAAE
ncbi:MAG: hypothetical protein Tsb0019_05830 [Roseibium sp.]